MNGRNGWKKLLDIRSHDIGFNYPATSKMRAAIRHNKVDRLTLSIEGNVLVTDTGSHVWRDYMMDPNEVSLLYPRMNVLQFEDWMTLRRMNGFEEMLMGRVSSCDMDQPFLRGWVYVTSDRIGNQPWPDQLNTQTWQVKMPTSILRDVFRVSADQLRELRRLGVMLLTKLSLTYDLEDGKWVGYIPEFDVGVDVSGHAISMLIMAGIGGVDINRYFETVYAMISQRFNRKKDPGYKAVIASRWVTEDAIRFPYKLWHTVWDYRAAINTYVIMGRYVELKINIRTIKIAMRWLDKIEEDFPKIIRMKRKELRTKLNKVLVS
jgi:hypothetical protein